MKHGVSLLIGSAIYLINISVSRFIGLSLNDQAVVVLRRVMTIVAIATVLLFFLPFAWGEAMPRSASFWRGSAYFGLIGFAFMLVEIPMIQRTILYLGNPNHATTVVLASMLLGAGLGSFASGKLQGAGVRVWCAALIVVLVVVNSVLASVFEATIGADWSTRAAVAFVFAGLLGVVAGVALPLGLIRFGDRSKAWFWAVNGASGVLASVSSLAFAMSVGFSATTWAGIACYAVAIPVLLRGRLEPPASLG